MSTGTSKTYQQLVYTCMTAANLAKTLRIEPWTSECDTRSGSRQMLKNSATLGADVSDPDPLRIKHSKRPVLLPSLLVGYSDPHQPRRKGHLDYLDTWYRWDFCITADSPCGSQSTLQTLSVRNCALTTQGTKLKGPASQGFYHLRWAQKRQDTMGDTLSLPFCIMFMESWGFEGERQQQKGVFRKRKGQGLTLKFGSWSHTWDRMTADWSSICYTIKPQSLLSLV